MHTKVYIALLYTVTGLLGAGASLAQPLQDSDATANQTLACFASLHTTPVSVQPCQLALQSAGTSSLERAQLHSALSMLLLQQDQLEAARLEMDAALAIGDLDDVILANLGSLLIREEDYRGAVIAFNNALSTTTTTTAPTSARLHNAVIYLNRSLALRALGRYDDASKDYATYLALFGLAPAQAEQMGPSEPVGRLPPHGFAPYKEPST